MLLLFDPLHTKAAAPSDIATDTMGLNYYASSPAVVLPPQEPTSHWLQHRPQDGEPTMADSCAMEVQHPPSPKVMKPRYPVPPSMNYIANSSNGIAGRKRSRADIGDDNDDAANSTAIEPPKPTVEPIMGPGMTLIYPDDPQLNIAAESQSGTWMEETAEREAGVSPERPRMIARKSMRLNSSDPVVAPGALQSSEIDPVVLKLGIGWKRLSEHQTLAVAGQETYIKNQFPMVHHPKILLQHEGLGIFIVRCNPDHTYGYLEEWWLFKDDLKSARFLCNNEAEVFDRLSNKVQDERGNWLPDIQAVGPILHAKDVSNGAQRIEAVSPTQVVEDVMMVE